MSLFSLKVSSLSGGKVVTWSSLDEAIPNVVSMTLVGSWLIVVSGTSEIPFSNVGDASLLPEI